MNTGKSIDNKQINVSLCRDPGRIVEILRRDYIDGPICYFPRSLLRALAQWIAKSDRMFLVTLDVDGDYAGFIFGHTMGHKTIWKRFAFNNPRHFFALLWVWIHMNILPWVRIHILRKTKTMNQENLAKLNNLNLPTLNRPFSWHSDDPQIGFTELLFVVPEYRGLGLSNYLSKYLYQEMSKRGVRLIEAHINADNYPAVRASLNHGFEIFKMTEGDFYARRNIANVQFFGSSLAQQISTYDSRTFLLLSSPVQWNLFNLRQKWEQLLESSDNLDLLYQYPQWFDHLVATDPNDTRLLLGVVKNDTGILTGISPIRVGRYSLKFDISSYALWKTNLRTAFILGSQPLLPPDERLYDRLFTALWENLPECDCIYMDTVPTESFLWQYLDKSKWLLELWIPHVVDGIQNHHALLLPPTFEEYLSKFKSKTRNTFKRKVKRLREQGGGRLEMLRVDSEDQVQAFLEGAASVARHSWQQKRLGTRIDNSRQHSENLTDLAGRGILRSYLLICGDKSCAFLLGYQFRGVYHYVEVAYDQSFSKFSPGTVLLYLLIEDLTYHNPPNRVNFGIGHASYKQEFGNVHFKDASVLLLRKNIPNKIRQSAHSLFRSCISTIKRQIWENE
jgi:GNAT superfamily N-acetyltransferase